MTVSKTLVATAAVTLLMGVSTAQAQHRGGGGQSRASGGQNRGGGGGERATARAPSGPRSGGAPRAVAPRSYSNGPSRSGQARVYGSPRAGVGASRSYAYSGSRSYGGYTRGYSGYRGGSRGGIVVGRSAPRIYGGGRFVNVRPVRFYRPYYTFRPRISLGFGLWAGFPIAYPSYYGYYDPYYDPYEYSYPATSYPAYPPSAYPPAAYPPSAYPSTAYPPSAYPRSGYPSGSVGTQGPNQANTGGVSFEMTPSTAEVFIDGEYVGTVDQFTPTSPPVGLTPGRHHIEIRAAGYRTMDLDADIVAGQVIPYQGTLQR